MTHLASGIFAPAYKSNCSFTVCIHIRISLASWRLGNFLSIPLAALISFSLFSRDSFFLTKSNLTRDNTSSNPSPSTKYNSSSTTPFICGTGPISSPPAFNTSSIDFVVSFKSSISILTIGKSALLKGFLVIFFRNIFTFFFISLSAILIFSSLISWNLLTSSLLFLVCNLLLGLGL